MNIENRFWKFHYENQHVYQMFCRFCREMMGAGYTVLSAGLIFERMRWETMILTNDPEFKLNNNYRAYYARLWMADHADTGCIFRIREVPSDKGCADELSQMRQSKD